MPVRTKICVITGTRAEYGLLKPLINELSSDNTFDLQLVVTGTHLSRKHGMTVEEIEQDNHPISARVPILDEADSTESLASAMSAALVGFTKEFKSLRPDLVVVLGDRFEIMAAVMAAHISRIPIAHIHGGETTEGLIDEAFRHSITKMSQLHFVAAEEYRSRVIQLGEHPSRVHLVGGLGSDLISRTTLLSKKDIEFNLKLKFKERNLLITFHPVTLEDDSSHEQLNELLKSLSRLEETTLIFTLPNADEGNFSIIDTLTEYKKINENAFVYHSLGTELYLSCIAQVDAVVGNSSSGLTEVPNFGKATINIGDRQAGRLKAKSVIDCDPNEESIFRSIQKAYDPDFQKAIQNCPNPYGVGGATLAIMERLKNLKPKDLLKKVFYDLEKN